MCKHRIITPYGIVNSQQLHAILDTQKQIANPPPLIVTPQPIIPQSIPAVVTKPVQYTPQPAITQTQGVLLQFTAQQNQGIASQPAIPTTVINSQNNSTQLLEEICLLKSFLQQKDALIEKLYNEKQELSNKLAISETNNVALSYQFNELKQDKIDLKADKAKLNEEVQQLKKEFTEIAHNSVIQDLSQIMEQQDHSSLLANNTQNDNNNPLLLADSVQSIQLNNTIPVNNAVNVQNNILAPQGNNNENMDNTTEILLAGQNSGEAHSEFSIIQ